MTDEQVIHVPQSGSVAFHPTHVDTPAGPTAGDQHIPHATSGDGVQKLSDNIQVVEFLLGTNILPSTSLKYGRLWSIHGSPTSLIPPRISGVLSI